MLSFGTFAALLVLFNFMLVITWFPACILFHHYHIKSCCKGKRVQPQGVEFTKTTLAEQGQEGVVTAPHTTTLAEVEEGVSTPTKGTNSPKPAPEVPGGRSVSALPPGAAPASGDNSGSGDMTAVELAQLSRVERFFYSKYAPLVSKKAFRYPVIAGFLCLTIFSSAIALLYLRPAEDPLSLFQYDAHYTNRRRTISEEFFNPADGFKIPVSVVWGVDLADPVDRQGIDMQDDSTLPVPHFAAEFTVNDTVQQEVITVRSLQDTNNITT
jgi:hypothetical protein